MNEAQWKATLAAAVDPGVERTKAAENLSTLAQQEESSGGVNGFREFVETRAKPLTAADMRWLRAHFLEQLPSLDSPELHVLGGLLRAPYSALPGPAAAELAEFLRSRQASAA